MRWGCAALVTIVVIGAALAGVVAWGAVRALQHPGVEQPATSAADASRAQQKVFDLVRRGRRSAGSESVTLTEREVNSLLTRQLAGELPLASPSVRLLGDGMVDVAGLVPLRDALSEARLTAVTDLLPAGWQQRPVWVRLRAGVRVDGGSRRTLHLDVQDFALGRQPLPTLTLRLVLDPAALGFLRWPLPQAVETVTVEPGRVVIRAASSR